jgi:hypothetical protein
MEGKASIRKVVDTAPMSTAGMAGMADRADREDKVGTANQFRQDRLD